MLGNERVRIEGKDTRDGKDFPGNRGNSEIRPKGPGREPSPCPVRRYEQATLENFKEVAKLAAEREDPPLLAAATLLVPGYVEKEEVSRIASFIAGIDPFIPYSLLAFHPSFEMDDLPCTSGKQAEECFNAALDADLKKVRIGNEHLLW